MNRLAIIGTVIAVAVAGGLLWWFTTGDAEPSTDVTAPEISTTTTTAAAADTAPDETTTTTEADETTTTEATAADATLFEIADGSTATFTIDEELRGNPVTVVGVSSIVLGQIQIDREELGNSQVGTILINARDFTTDSGTRDRAIRGPILDTEVIEFIEFAPTSIDGLSGPLEPDTDLSFTITGDLKIRDVVNSVTFDVTARVNADGTLSGTAETTVLRGDYELTIPNAPGVANVADEVPLALDFVAAPAG